MIPPVPPDRRPGSYDLDAASDEAAYVETMPSLTVQSMTEDADLNVMMKRFGITGKMPEDVRMPTYGDYTDVSDYRSAIHAAWEAEANFMKFPAHIRAQFENNPQLFLDFVDNPANIKQVQEWFPKESVNGNQGNAGGNAPPSSGVATPSGGGGTPSGDGGAAVPK